MAISRRLALKALVAGGTSVAVSTVGAGAQAASLPTPAPDAVGLLYDTTLCIGCKACVVACAEANDLELASRGNLVWRKTFDQTRHLVGVGPQLSGPPIKAYPVRRTVGDAGSDNDRVREQFDPVDSQLHAIWMCGHRQHFEYLRT